MELQKRNRIVLSLWITCVLFFVFIIFGYFYVNWNDDVLYENADEIVFTVDKESDFNELASLSQMENVAFYLQLQGLDGLKQWCEGKQKCKELVIDVDGDKYSFTIEELIKYKKGK